MMKKCVILGSLICLLLSSCKQVDLYVRTQNIKDASWNSQQVPSFSFDIKDTLRPYNVSVVLRHTNQYPYRNIWLKVGVQLPEDTMRHQQFELALASPDKWLGVGMDDIYEHRALLFPKPIQFNKIGTVTFTLQQIMRRDPLPGVMQAGLRVEPMQ